MTEKPPVRITCFGAFEVWLPESDSRLQWRTRKAKELFAYLVHVEGTFVDRDTLLEKLWLEQEKDYSISGLHNIIYSIRRNLELSGRKDLLLSERGKYRLQYEEMEADMKPMQRMARAVEQKNFKELCRYQNMLIAYKGPYMDKVGGEWHLELADYFENIHVRGCCLWAGQCMEEKRYGEAIKYLKSGLYIDMYAEHLAAMLIVCYKEIRDYGNMRRQYEKYTAILRRDLGIGYSEMLNRAYRDVGYDSWWQADRKDEKR